LRDAPEYQLSAEEVCAGEFDRHYTYLMNLQSETIAVKPKGVVSYL